MMPTLLGRWQTRIFLLGTIGVLVTFLFGLLYRDFVTPFALLGYVLLLGLSWDILYDFLQSLRWERDWPPLFTVIGALLEGLLVWGVITADSVWGALGLTSFPGIHPELTLIQFMAHYGTVFIITLAMMLGPMKILFPQWRFNGGRLR